MEHEHDCPAAILRAGDILIVGLQRQTFSIADADAYRAKLLERIPGLADVVLLADVSALAAYRGGEAR